jgi:hypothetical protein
MYPRFKSFEGTGVELVEGEAAGVCVAVDVGFSTAIATPLFHISFLPFLMQVYFLPLAVAVVPTFLQVSPVFTAAIAFMGTRITASAIKEPSHFFM